LPATPFCGGDVPLTQIRTPRAIKMLTQLEQEPTVAFFVLILAFSCLTSVPVDEEPRLGAATDTLSAEMRRMLNDELTLWYPLSLDTVYGGFYSDINYRWELDGRQQKMIVTQARHVWSTSNAAMFYKDDRKLRTVAAHGVQFLRNTMWDRTYGGFYDLVDRRGEPVRENGQIVKRAYGNAFAIYGLSCYYRATGDSTALRLAQETFRWLENHSHDPLHGGYFQFLSREGSPFIDGYRHTPPRDQNSTIHLLECLTELYKAWPDPTVQKRLHELLHIVRDIITTDTGYMVLFFDRNWTPVCYRDSSSDIREKNEDLDHVSFGHDVETAYLMLEASETLGITNDTTTLRVAKKMVDHALRYGWDAERGGLYDRGYYYGKDNRATVIKKTKEWWSQAEALNSFLMMSELFPKDEMDYYAKFRIQWKYCLKYLIDGQHGGWYWGGADIVPANRYSPKGSIWKGNYHTSRALINCLRRLEK
jgi:mannobiose 2-epimerase